jgi:hypothetical protein
MVQAGTVYIPLPGVQAVGNINYEVRVAVTNPGAAQQSIKYLQIGMGTDGTKARSEPSTQAIAAGKTFVFKPNDQPGLLEITAPAGLEYSARLVGTGEAAGLGTEIPVITYETAAAANEKLFVQGLRNSTTRRTDVILINLGKKATKCSATTRRADGTVLVNALSIAFPPLSHAKYSNVFADMALDDARVEVSCQSEFFAYVQLHDSATGEFSVAGPTGGSDSRLFAPGEESPAATCASGTQGTTCYAYPGVVHISTKSNPVRHIYPAITPGTYGAVHIRLEVEVNGWNLDTNTTGAHGVLYFVRNGNKEMWASIFFRPPGRKILGFRHGFFKNHGQKIAIDRPFEAEVGTTYEVDYMYDTRSDTIDLRILVEGVEVERIQSSPDVGSVIIGPKDKVWIGLSNPGLYPKPEPYSRNWVYKNLLVEFLD